MNLRDGFDKIRNRFCITRWLFGNRRKEEKPIPQERRGSPMKRSKAVSDRLDRATDDLCKTVSMSRKDFDNLLGGDK